MSAHPFRVDPSNTAAFAAIADEVPLATPATPFRAVVVGGGTGAPMSIRALLSLGCETSAVVAMADDGGSTGILREEANATPPGDIRKCLAAFAADPTDPFTRAFRYRFDFAQHHTLGNLMLTALEDATGSFPEAIAVCERLLDARGHVYPSTLAPVRLIARTKGGDILEGQANACAAPEALTRVWFAADRPARAFEPALAAIRAADLVVLGPGSLFTSIIPNLLVEGVLDALRESRARTLFVCGLADAQGETRGMSAREHVEALLAHGMEGRLDCVLVHAPHLLAVPPEHDVQAEAGVRSVAVSAEDVAAIEARGVEVMLRDLADPVRPSWHEPRALRAALAGVMRQCRSRQM